MLRPLLLALLGAAPVLADPALGPAEPHLPILARTGAEAARVVAALAAPADFATVQPYEALAAGAATLPAGADALTRPPGALSLDDAMRFELGRALFDKLWVAAPASTRASDGLGPVFNARSCRDCHGGSASQPVLRVALPGGPVPDGIAGWHPTRPEPSYGRQVQDRATPAVAAEARVAVTHRDLPVMLGDGTPVSLRAPSYRLATPAFGPLAPGTLLSPRVAPPLFGLGLLEAVPAADILALADPGDADGDGISGRAQIVPSAEFATPMLGRFGWKAGQPTLRAQAAAALALDLGLSNPLHRAPWGDCTAAQTACRAAPHGQQPGQRDGLEVDGASLDLIAFYAGSLGVPERQAADRPAVLRGKASFHALGCAACHRPAFVTHRLADDPDRSFQLIWPYSDLLLHDMGPGLADGLPEGRAAGAEWRTPPLWGRGLTGTEGGRSQFLHDGRARSLTEAILWHGGEAEAARTAFAGLSAQDRLDLIAFLESL